MLLVTSLIVIMALGYWCSTYADSLGMRLFSQKLTYVGACHVYYLIFFFVLQYWNINLPRPCHIAMISLNMLVMISVLFCEYHPFFYREVSFFIADGIPMLHRSYGFMHTLYQLSMFGYLGATYTVCIYGIVKNPTVLQRTRSIVTLLILSLFFPTCFYLFEKLFHLDFTIIPFGLVIGEFMLLILVYRLKLYDIWNVANEFVFKVLSDAIIIFDKQYQYKACNEMAKKLFPKLQHALVNSGLGEIDPKLVWLIQDGLHHDMKFDDKVYVPVVRPVFFQHHISGYVLWLSDVTSERLKTQLQENYQHDLECEVNRKTARLEKMQEQMLTAFANMMENRDGVTGGHAKRTSAYVNAITNGLVKRNLFTSELNESFCHYMKLAAPLHDIGKIAIPDMILNKIGRYTEEEYTVMKQHSAMGAEILQQNLSSLEDQDFFRLICDTAHYHHEKWNGGGYPSGLKKTEIPLCARIMSVADVFDALVSRRPYKDEFSIDKAYEIIKEERNVSFDPQIADCFIEIRPEIEKIFYSLKIEENES